MVDPLPLVLASQSPRRRQLLARQGIPFEAFSPDDEAEDDRGPDERPEDYVRRLALQKARNVAAKIDRGRIVACDTIVLCDGEILEKPTDRDDARRMLRFSRGKRQIVLSGLCVLDKRPDNAEAFAVETDTTELFMHPLSDEEIEDYLAGTGWQGKAGAFGYQDRHDWLTLIRGSESNIVGLPMELLEKMLSSMYYTVIN